MGYIPMTIISSSKILYTYTVYEISGIIKMGVSMSKGNADKL